MSITYVEERNPERYHYTAPKRPEIRKIGTIMCDMVETTPIVFKGVLYRFESVRDKYQNEANTVGQSYFQFVDVKTNEATKAFGFNYHFGAAYTEGDYMYVTGTTGKAPDATEGYATSNIIKVFRSADLENWEIIGEVVFPEDTRTFNTGICKKDGVYTMLIEVNKPISFRFRFAQSTDMKNWTLLSEEHRFHENPRYAGGPAIYTIEGDPYYYVLYLEKYPEWSFANSIARSKDLIKWEYSPINPVLMYEEDKDKMIANPLLTEHERARISRALDVNNSDLEMCEFGGRTIMYYSWGSQRGIEFLAEASYEGTMKELLQSYFDIE